MKFGGGWESSSKFVKPELLSQSTTRYRHAPTQFAFKPCAEGRSPSNLNMAGKARNNKKIKNVKKAKRARGAKEVKAFRTTRKNFTAPAAVFMIPELIEHILSYVQQSDIIRARRITTFVKNASEGSRRLQSMIFLAQDKSLSHAFWTLNSQRRITVSRLSPVVPAPQSERSGYRFIYNPLLLRQRGVQPPSRSFSPAVKRPSRSLRFRECVARITFAIAPKTPAALYCWNMLLTQPPISRMRVEIRFNDSQTGYQDDWVVAAQRGRDVRG